MVRRGHKICGFRGRLLHCSWQSCRARLDWGSTLFTQDNGSLGLHSFFGHLADLLLTDFAWLGLSYCSFLRDMSSIIWGWNLHFAHVDWRLAHSLCALKVADCGWITIADLHILGQCFGCSHRYPLWLLGTLHWLVTEDHGWSIGRFSQVWLRNRGTNFCFLWLDYHYVEIEWQFCQFCYQ